MSILDNLDTQKITETIIAIVISQVIFLILVVIIITPIATDIQKGIGNEINSIKIAAATEIQHQINNLTIECTENWKENTIKIQIGKIEQYCEVKRV